MTEVMKILPDAPARYETYRGGFLWDAKFKGSAQDADPENNKIYVFICFLNRPIFVSETALPDRGNISAGSQVESSNFCFCQNVSNRVISNLKALLFNPRTN